MEVIGSILILIAFLHRNTSIGKPSIVTIIKNKYLLMLSINFVLKFLTIILSNTKNSILFWLKLMPLT